ncbi:MAG: hypothetical protein PHX30_04500 [Candidatus Pacebacteria bacterium]|nr:hypothetical protein [Candidatus Paceibacterota bacterium]
MPSNVGAEPGYPSADVGIEGFGRKIGGSFEPKKYIVRVPDLSPVAIVRASEVLPI